MFNAIEYSQTNYQCMYIFFSPGKKESSFGKRKKELPFEKLRIIEFEKRSAPFRRKKRKITIIFNSPREKKRRKKQNRKIVRRKEVSSVQRIIFSFVSATKGREKKRLKGERLVNDGHNCGLLSQ